MNKLNLDLDAELNKETKRIEALKPIEEPSEAKKLKATQFIFPIILLILSFTWLLSLEEEGVGGIIFSLIFGVWGLHLISKIINKNILKGTAKIILVLLILSGLLALVIALGPLWIIAIILFLILLAINK